MSENPFLHIDQQMAGDCYTSTEVMDNLITLCDDFGSRFAGTDGERLAADFIKEKLIAYGCQNVSLEPVDYLGWIRGQTTLRLTAPTEKTIPGISLPHSPPIDLEAEIIDLGDGSPDDFAKYAAEIPGKIVMVNSKTLPTGMNRWMHRGEKYGRAMLAGAAGFIFVNHYPAYGPATGGIGRLNQQAPIPGISLAYEEGAFIQRLIKRFGSVKIHLQSDDRCEPMRSWNIVGELPGDSAKPQIVMLGSHVDGHDISQGAGDPASGAVAVMEAARLLANYAGKLPHTIRFALWGVEEIGLLGSSQYVADHADELDDFRFYFNMDGAGAVKVKDVVLNEWEALEALFAEYREQMGLEFAIGQSVHAHSDHFPFLMQGVPTGGMETVEKDLSGRGYGHTKYDTVDKVEIRGLREAATMAARLAARIASETDWGVSRRSQEAALEILNDRKYQEERAITAEIRAYLEKVGESKAG